MDDDLRHKLVEAYNRLPPDCRSLPASEEALLAYEGRLGPIPSDFRWFLKACGGGVIGSEWVDDVTKLALTHAKFQKEPWTMKDVFVIGWDGAGNPFGIERRSGKVLVEDHNFGGIHELSPSFMEFLTAGLLKLDR